MINNLLSIVILLCLGSQLWAQDNIKIKGTIQGVQSGKLYVIAQVGENKVDTLGFTNFNQPNFMLTAKVKEPIYAQIVLGGYQGGFSFFAEPGGEYTALLNNNNSAYIKGGTINDKWNTYYTEYQSKTVKLNNMKQRYDSLKKANKFRSASALNDSLTIKEKELEAFNTSFLHSADDIINAYLTLNKAVATDANLDKSLAMYNNLAPKAKNSVSGRILKQRIDRLAMVGVGSMAPDFTLLTEQGKELTLSHVKAKVKIVDFWASWCRPCRMNNPSLISIYNTFHSKGLEIIGVSLDDKKERWQAAINQDKLPWINVSSLNGWKCAVAKQYNVRAIPALFVLDQNNKVIAVGLKGEKLRAFLETILK